jgi:hypothetical protein
LLTRTGGSQKSFTPTIIRDKDEIFLSHTFERKGLYDVDINIDNNLISTYVIKVR